MLELIYSPEAWISLTTLTALEIVLGIDNIIFISILAGRLPPHERDKGRKFGLMGALVSRLALLSLIAWIVKLQTPLFYVLDIPMSGKSLILFIGGLFLIFKATKEIHHKIEDTTEELLETPKHAKLSAVITQIMLIDIVFSLDSVITAVGMAQHLSIMVIANIIALAIMLLAAKSISEFVDRNPTIKVLALSFLLMIGLVLVADGLSFHIPKGYVYFAMAFSFFVEIINMKVVRNKKA